MSDALPVSSDDLRAAIARSGIHAYLVGARARINPIRLSRILHGREPLTTELAARILTAVDQEAAHGR
jgi:hypothetical protein